MEAATTQLRRLPPQARALTLRRVAARAFPQLVGTLALLGILGGTLLVVIAADQGLSQLSETVRTNSPGWVTWPFAGLWPNRTVDHWDIQVGLLVVLLAMLACYGVAIWIAERIHPAIVWGAIALVYVVCALSPPLLLTDIFNYVGYARMGVIHHLNPYTHVPFDIRHDPIFKLNNWHHLPSPYGPLFTLGTYALAPLSIGAAYWTYKVAVMVASVACLVLVFAIARRIERPPLRAVILVGLNPLVLIYGTAGQHNDAFVLLFVLASVYLTVSRREARGAFAMVGAAAMKATGVVLVPLVALGARDRRRAIAGTLAGVVLFGAMTLGAFGPHIPAVRIQSRLVTPFSIPNIAGLALGRGGVDAAMRSALAATLIVATLGCSYWAWRRRNPLEPLGWLSLITVVTLAWDMPWYVLWVLPFIAFVPRRAFRVAAIAVAVWMTIQWLPLVSNAMHSIGVIPSKGHVWHVNARYTAKYLK